MFRFAGGSLSLSLLMLLLFNFPTPSLAWQGKPAAGADNTVLLTIGGRVARPLKLNGAELAKLPRRTVAAKDHNGKEVSFEGIELIEILRLAGIKGGENLRGHNLSEFLTVEAADGYRVVFSLAEIDPAFTSRVVLLADRRDGKPLAATEGPLRIVMPDEKVQARWVRQVVSLSIGSIGAPEKH